MERHYETAGLGDVKREAGDLKNILHQLSGALNTPDFVVPISSTEILAASTEAAVIHTYCQEFSDKNLADMLEKQSLEGGFMDEVAPKAKVEPPKRKRILPDKPLQNGNTKKRDEQQTHVSRKGTKNRCSGFDLRPGHLQQGKFPEEYRMEFQQCKIISRADQSDFHIVLDICENEAVCVAMEAMQDANSWISPLTSLPVRGDAVCCKTDAADDGAKPKFERALVFNSNASAGTAQVYCVDAGTTKWFKLGQIYGLPPELQEIPALAIPCSLLGVDRDKLNLFWIEKFAVGFTPPCQVLCIYYGETTRYEDGRLFYVIELYHPTTKKRITKPFVPV